ncbi:MAG TPA: hypothetical protein VII78_11045 [Myxococcota bacterium]
MDARQLERARAGSRVDFDRVYERFFPRCFRAALLHVADPHAAELCTRLALHAMFEEVPRGHCVAEQVLRSLRASLRSAE